MEALNYFRGYLTDKKLPTILSKDFGGIKELSGNYVPSTDVICINRAIEPRWALYTIAHELMHSSGHKERLNRFTLTHNDVPYNKQLEEITADTGAYIISSIVGGHDFLLEAGFKTLVSDEIGDLKKQGLEPSRLIDFEGIYNGVGYWLKKDYKKRFFDAKRYLLEISK